MSQIATVVGQLVDLAGGGRRKLPAGDDAVALEGTQPLGEELAADSRQTVDPDR